MKRERAVVYFVFAAIFTMGIATGWACEKINHYPVQDRCISSVYYLL